MKLRIGKAKDNDYVVDNPHASRYHAQLVRGDDGGWLLEDTDSTNGTFVNGQQILRKRVTPADAIALGDPSCVVTLSEILRYNNDYSEEFAALKKVYDEYIAEKIKVQSSNLFRARLFQSLPFALPGVIGVTIGFLGKGSSWLFGVSLLVVICAPAIGIYLGAKQSAKMPGLLQEMTVEFRKKYVCPKCGTYLGEQPWDLLANKKQCPACKAKWMNE
ncbi:hypothetical protein Barb7_00640 [Bacteroidales bacterium Barb7]|nr:hypothetical protein Barb7_00640 [Bacteroidales bacterium Barb7]